MTGNRGRHRGHDKRRVSIVSGALIIIAGLVIAVGARAATRLLSPAALAATAPVNASGTDVSNLTTVTSWANVKSAGMTFVGVMAYDGASVSNPSYNSQVTGALNQGLYVMPYVVADPLKVTDGATQFTQHAWPAINGVPGAPYGKDGQYLPVVLDLEAQPQVTSDPCYGLSTSQMVTWIGQFTAKAQSLTGLTPVIYTSPSWWQQCTANSTAFKANPLWIANYGVATPAVLTPWPGYTFWQSSSSGAITGITGPADLDQFEGTVTAAAGSTGSFQVQTLSSLTGQPVTYTATSSLPSGVSLSGDGKGILSWSTATAVGEYPITVAAQSSAVTPVPSSVSLTLRVHGTISLASANRSSTAGNPVILSVPATGPDKTAGFPATLKAAGLPPGLTMASNGLITGWLIQPGTYKVTVTASDALGGTGTATFTWTVNAASNSGTTGSIHQIGGSAKCLDDPGSKTANGTVIDLSTCTGKSNQAWTIVQDGSIRVLGKCLSTVSDATANGTRLQITACNAKDGAQHWRAANDSQLYNVKSGKCLDVPVASAGNGTKPVIEPCANSTSQPNEHWLRPAAPVLSGLPGKCMATSGSPVVPASCANAASQHWQMYADGTIRQGGKCLTESGTNSGAVLWIGTCTGSAATKWRLNGAGPIAVTLNNAASGRCVTVPSSGRLVMGSCATTPAGTWHVE